MYNITLSSQAEKTYIKLYKKDKILFNRIRYALECLKTNPLEGKPLKDKLKGKRSLRVGMYRIIYSVIKQSLIIHILDIGHRREIYR